MLLGLNNHPGNTDSPGFEKGLTQERINFASLVDRNNIIGPLKINEWNVSGRHKHFDLNRLSGFWISSRDLLLAQNHILPILIFDSLDNIFLVDFFPRLLVNTLVPDRIHAAL